MSQADAPVVEPIAPRRWSRGPRLILAGTLLVAIALAAGLIWVKVARTIDHPRPVKVSKQPKVAALAWSNRVFLDVPSFKRWLANRDVTYASWARKHPQGVALLEHERGN